MPDPFSWTSAAPYFLVAFAFGYLLGSIPFGVLVTRIGGLGDLRKVGSGNIGATNVLRTGSKKLAGLTLLGDLAKGTIAVWVAKQYGPDTAVIAGLGALLGHCFPVWLGFRGGKGVATYIGILLAFTWKIAALFCAIWLTSAVITRYSSLSALVASVATCVALYYTGLIQLAELFVLLTVILWLRHWQNIARLLKGTESRIGDKN